MSNKNSIRCHRVGDYLIPNLILPPEETNMRLGKWGMMHKDYLLKHKPITVAIMTAEGRFWRYLADVDTHANEMFDLLVEQMKKKEGITEQLKAQNQLEWIQRINIIQQRSSEVVTKEIIYV